MNKPKYKNYLEIPKRKPVVAKPKVTKAPKEKKPSIFSKKLNIKMGNLSSFSFVTFSTKEQTFFAKRLSFLIKAGVPMLESINLISKQTKSKSRVKIFERIISDVANGQSLATSLGRFRRLFGGFAINIIKSGESSGTLTQNLNYLADELKKKELLRKKIMSAMLYPLIITVATFGITGLLTVYIFPKIMPIFQGMNVELPLSTRIIIFVSDLLRHQGLWIFLGLILFVVGFIILLKNSPRVRFVFDGFILRVPIMGKIAKNYNITNTCRTLGLLLKSGISLTEGLIITADTTENVQYKKVFNELSTGVMKGKNMSELIDKYPSLFPPMIGHMISIGEKSGNLSNTLIYLSEFYENEFEEVTKNLSSAIEPVLMIVMGLMVGFVAISIITPIYSITQHLSPR